MLRLFDNRYSETDLIALSAMLQNGFVNTIKNCTHNCDECVIKRPCDDMYRLLDFISVEVDKLNGQTAIRRDVRNRAK